MGSTWSFPPAPRPPTLTAMADAARVLLAGMTPILRDLVRDVLGAQPDIEVVGEVDADAELAAVARQRGANIVLVGGEELQMPDAWWAVLALRPPVRLLALTGRGGGATVCEALDELSLDDLLAAIRR